MESSGVVIIYRASQILMHRLREEENVTITRLIHMNQKWPCLGHQSPEVLDHLWLCAQCERCEQLTSVREYQKFFVQLHALRSFDSYK